MTKASPPLAKGPAMGAPEGHIIDAAEIYGLYFHGPAYQVIEKAWWDGKRIVGLMANGLRNNHNPPELPTRMAPRWIELCFQTAGIWEMGIAGRMGLPRHIDRISLLSDPEQARGRTYAVVTPDPSNKSFDAEIVDAQGNTYLQLSGYRTVEIPNAVNSERLKMLQAAMSMEVAAA